MMRRSCGLLATSIPRHVWDPSRHNPNWADSYSTEIADRRSWPAKKWSIGLEPKTPSEWNQYSLRNLAYAYNGALRACNTFPDMIHYYQEMKQRGVKVDLDTLNTLLTRASRFEKMKAEDVFRLYDEMTELGARPDLATAETLHTVWEFSASKAPPEWREVRRRHLIRIYNALADADVQQYAGKDLQNLLGAQMKRYRDNLRSLQASISPSVYKRYVSTITSFDVLIHEVNNFLWEFVQPDHAAKEDPTLKIRVPVLYTVMKRPLVDEATSQSQFEDSDVCGVLLSAVERVIDHPMDLKTPSRQRFALLALQSLIGTSGVLVTADLVAQLMEAVKYGPIDESRDRDAMRVLANALRATSFRADDGLKKTWIALQRPCDARTVGRYLAARDPWSPSQFAPQGATFPLFAAGNIATVASASENASAETAVTTTDEVSLTTSTHVLRTADEVDARWANVWELVERTSALSDLNQTAAHRVEVFTGLAVFLRHMFTEQRLHSRSGELIASFTPSTTMEVCERIFNALQDVRRRLDAFCNEHSVAPELECWESMLVVLRGMMDFYVMQKKGRGGGASADSEAFFVSVAELRAQLVDESRSRFDGRFKLLWLQEA